jgi:hypothetical protein
MRLAKPEGIFFNCYVPFVKERRAFVWWPRYEHRPARRLPISGVPSNQASTHFAFGWFRASVVWCNANEVRGAHKSAVP